MSQVDNKKTTAPEKASTSRRNFAPMPLAVMASDAPPRAKLLILALYHHDWDGVRAWPSQERLSKIMSCSRETVGLATKDCIDRKWIVVKKRFSDTPIYELNVPNMTLDEFNAATGSDQMSEKPTSVKRVINSRKSRHQLSEKPTSDVGKAATNREPLNENHEQEREQTPSLQAAPSKAETLALLCAPWKAKYGFDLAPKNAELAAKAAQVYGDDLARSWARYLASPGTRGKLDQERHPLAWFVDQVDSWRTAAAPAGVDPAKVRAHQQQLAEQDRVRESRQAAIDARREQLEKLWPTLPTFWRDHLLQAVAALNDFGADVVQGLRAKNGGQDLSPSTWTAETILELWPGFPALPSKQTEVSHG